MRTSRYKFLTVGKMNIFRISRNFEEKNNYLVENDKSILRPYSKSPMAVLSKFGMFFEKQQRS